MLGRVLGLVAVLAVLGVGGGYAAAVIGEEQVVGAGTAAPVPAESPSVPVTTVAPFAKDQEFPTLEPGLEYSDFVAGVEPYQWTVAAPLGWVTDTLGFAEKRVRPVGNPLGGYGLRVKVVNEHKTPATMADQKLLSQQATYDDVVVLARTDDTLSLSFRHPRNWQRFKIYRWFTREGSEEAELEISVSGRAQDRPGMDDLLEQVSDSVRAGGPEASPTSSPVG